MRSFRGARAAVEGWRLVYETGDLSLESWWARLAVVAFAVDTQQELWRAELLSVEAIAAVLDRADGRGIENSR